MNTDEAMQRFQAAHRLLLEPMTSREKFDHVAKLVRGINPRLDAALEKTGRALSTIDKVADGDVVSLSAESLPETTAEEKKRKSALLLFIRSWKDLESEVQRVAHEMEQAEAQGQSRASTGARLFSAAKGPLGVITVLAIGIVALQQTAVAVTIQNRGCGTLEQLGSLPPLPGFTLPQESIPNGGEATMTIPPLPLDIDGAQSGKIVLSAIRYSFTIELPASVKEVSLNGQSLLGKQTKVRLSEKDQHTLLLRCQ